MTTPPTDVLSPSAWCRRILTSLSQRKLQDREAGYLEMLLTYVIERDPSLDAFDEMLVQYEGDARTGIAEAAGLLARAWRRATAASAAAPPPPLQETLRTLGGLLDEAGARGAYLMVAIDSALVQTFGDMTQVRLGPIELRQTVAARMALRGQVAPADPAVPERYETLLRAVGTELDAELPQAYELVVTRRTVVVEGSEGYYSVLTIEQLTALLHAALAQREEDDSGGS